MKQAYVVIMHFYTIILIHLKYITDIMILQSKITLKLFNFPPQYRHAAD